MQDKTAHQDITAVLEEVANAVVGKFEMTALLNNIIHKTMETLHAEVCSIFLEDRQSEPGALKCVAGSGFAKKLVDIAKYESGEGLTGNVFKFGVGYNSKTLEEHKNLEINGKKVWEGKFDPKQWPSGENEFRNGIGLPLKIKSQILGVIKVENKIKEFGDFFSAEDFKIFRTIANVIALTIENARLHHQIEDQLKTIASKAAHRINNQVTSYDGIELELRDEADSAIPNKEHLLALSKRLGNTTENLKGMIQDFKTYGKPIILSKKLADINEVVINEIWLAKPPVTITIEQILDRNLPPFKFDSGRLAESIKELLHNAIRIINDKSIPGRITISTKLIKTEGDDLEPGKFAMIKIEDNGPGFPSNFPVFSPFHSTDPQRTGLGLATVKELIEAHGGKAKFIPKETSGACFELLIPIE
ncbi:GAF domain-containing sensor histidine kinase [candidate division KSB1 bacterium]|nr:GAF domain-containing sensor histidine kinase [candidate division KSB1 bacterium]